MKYIFDSSAITYMLEAFPRKLIDGIWDKFLDQCRDGSVISDKETKDTLENELTEIESYNWLDEFSLIFKKITQKEAEKLGELVDKKIFDFYNDSAELRRKLPVAIPFIVVIAIIQKRKIVINKTCKDKSKIIDICQKLKDETGIEIVEIEDYLLSFK